MKKIQVLPEAFFDSLSISHKLGDSLVDFRSEEIHLFSYFASILFLYNGNSLAGWKYKFILDGKGYPFSDYLNESIKRHRLSGVVEEHGEYLRITPKGVDEYYKFKNLKNMLNRDECINAACATNILLPYSKTLRALLRDPELEKRKITREKKTIDNSYAYEKFKEISEAVGIPENDLAISAVAWINYINEKYYAAGQ
ncbi:MAG: hypothetical protein LBB39_00400 [Mycoplasmataceae bacterium]|jgi:arsenate reductase-like glutaredoxin family protein|nr:hypothetical protein [Mycoplasmataceae bacterium]